MIYQISELRRNLEIFKSLFESVHDELIHWKKDEDHWCYLEVICHLLDEEREDFRLRLQTLLNQPEADFISIDPVGWVKDRDYINQEFHEKCQAFYNERSDSLKYLESLDEDDPGWFNTKDHKYFGKISPQYFLNNWVTHDYLHIRQLQRIKYDYMDMIADHSIEYAGKWK